MRKLQEVRKMAVKTDVIQFPTKGHSDILDITN